MNNKVPQTGPQCWFNREHTSQMKFAHLLCLIYLDGTFCRGVQLLSIFFAGSVRVVSSHGNETVCVYVANSAHVESGHNEVHSQLAHIPNSHCWLVGRIQV